MERSKPHCCFSFQINVGRPILAAAGFLPGLRHSNLSRARKQAVSESPKQLTGRIAPGLLGRAQTTLLPYSGPATLDEYKQQHYAQYARDNAY